MRASTKRRPRAAGGGRLRRHPGDGVGGPFEHDSRTADVAGGCPAGQPWSPPPTRGSCAKTRRSGTKGLPPPAWASAPRPAPVAPRIPSPAFAGRGPGLPGGRAVRPPSRRNRTAKHRRSKRPVRAVFRTRRSMTPRATAAPLPSASILPSCHHHSSQVHVALPVRMNGAPTRSEKQEHSLQRACSNLRSLDRSFAEGLRTDTI